MLTGSDSKIRQLCRLKMNQTNPPPDASWFRRRVGHPLFVLLRQGSSPEKIALCIVLGSFLSVFPLFGVTTILCAIAAVVFRLNLPAIQAINWLLAGVHVLLIIPFLRVGEWLTRSPPLAFSAAQVRSSVDAGALAFFSLLGASILRAILGWFVTAAPLGLVMYRALVPVLRRYAARRAAHRAAHHAA